MKKERSSNIELLRIICICMVLCLHFNNDLYGSAFLYTKDILINNTILKFIQSLSACAVNVFIIISGYYLCLSSKRTVGKIIELFFWVMIYQVGSYIFKVVLEQEQFSTLYLIKEFLPKNYYVLLYSALFFVSPYLNKLIDSLSKNEYKKMLAIFIFLFSVYPSIIDIFCDFAKVEWYGISTISMIGGEEGYTIVNFILLYFIAGYISRFQNSITWVNSSKYNVIGYFISCVLIFALSIFSRQAWNYNNIFVIASAVFLFNSLKNVKISYHRIINYFAASTFGIFLVHEYVIKKICAFIQVENFCKSNAILLLLGLTITIVALYFVSFSIDFLTKTITSILMKRFEKTKIYNFNI